MVLKANPKYKKMMPKEPVLIESYSEVLLRHTNWHFHVRDANPESGPFTQR
jgi:hypothetical protein